MASVTAASPPVTNRQGRRQQPGGSRARRIAEPFLFLLPSLALVGVFIAYPMIRAIWFSLNHASLLAGIGQFVGFHNYSSILFGSGFGGFAITSIEWTFGAVALQLIFGMLGALLLNQRMPLRGTVRGLAMVPWATPSVLVALIWLWLLDPNHGVINAVLKAVGVISHPITWLSGTHTALPTLIVVDTWQGVPFFAVMILAALQSVPGELRESARIDGCGAFGVFRRVVLPHILPTVLITVVLRIMWTANYIDLAYILTGGGPGTSTTTLPLQSYLTAYKAGDFGQGAAYAVVQAAILAIFVVIYVRLTARREAS